ncbi:sugar kinase [Heyndrickxia faecalis]|uniref:sugar kinase n=1 Tax=Heyndrickxia faecalis TaxID=2824910 RepID=UPI00359A8596
MDVVSIGETMVLFTSEMQGLMRYARNFSVKIAGAETNTLIGLSRLGHQTGWISKLGQDEFGELVLSTVRGEGVNISRVTRDSSSPTGIFFKEFLHDGHVRVHYYRAHSAASRLEKRDIDENYIRNAKYLYLTGITPALSGSCREAVFTAIEYAKKYGIQIVFDPNIRKKLWKDADAKEIILRIAKKADIVLPGMGEGDFLFGTSNPEMISEHFLNLGSRLVAVKLGADGAYFATENEKGTVSGYKIHRVIDPVGAGDGFAAGVLSGLLDHLNTREAVQRGCAIGAMVATVNGDIEGLPDKKLLRKFMNPENVDEVSR